ncbi:MAG: MATE family efflux transporter [bacterium]|nr:MATE family efflux transporter [bacterium]
MAIPRAAKELGRAPVGYMLFRYSMPAIIGMLVMIFYNVVDRLYVSHAVGEAGLAGFALTFPLSMITIAFGTLIGIGTATQVSIAMGKGKRDVARCYLGQSVCIYLFFSLILFPAIALFLEPILAVTGGTPASIPYAVDYLQIYLCGTIFQYGSFGINGILRAEGSPKTALFMMLLGAVINLIADPFFIFDAVPLYFFKAPGLGWGIQGAAVATVLGQACAAIFTIIHFLRPSATIRLKLGYIKVYRPLVWGVLAVGVAPFALNIMGSIVNMLYNILFKYWAATDAEANLQIASIGIIMTVQMVVAMPVFGLAQGMQPIVGFNYGAKNYKRLLHAYTLAKWYAGAYVFIMALLTILFRHTIIGLFCNETTSTDLLEFGPTALLIFFCGFFFVGYAIIVGQYFQSIGRSGISIIMSLSRQCTILIPLMIIMPLFFGSIGIWWAVPISDIVSILIALWFDIREHRRIHTLMAS